MRMIKSEDEEVLLVSLATKDMASNDITMDPLTAKESGLKHVTRNIFTVT